MAAEREMRVGDAEREAAAAELREHFASGRLTQEELDERLDRAFAAKTRADLAGVFTDLPSGREWAGGPAGAFGASRSSGTYGAGGPFAASGPFGDRGPFGACGPRASEFSAGWQAAARMILVGIMVSVGIFTMFMVGILGVFGIGVARPIGILLLVLSFVLRRVFGWRRRAGGPRRRRR